jgi:peptidyl-prolyl cis-trans isomerase D
MQIIQTIRDKGAAIVIAVIALSLIGLILMDAKQGSSRFFSSLSSSIGKVNGDAIEKAEFEKKVKMADDMAKQQASQSGRQAPDVAQVRQQVWDQMVSEKVFYAEIDKLGIDFTSSELSSILNSNDPSNPLMQDQGMLDPNTGMLDQAKVAQAIKTIKTAKGEQFDYINTQIAEPQKNTSIVSKYNALLNAAAYYPTWMQEKDNAESKNFANISVVNIPYGVIPDSTIKVSDDEITNYVQKHKSQFKQEEGRMISYVSFTQSPSAEDSNRTKDYIAKLKESFASDPNPAVFIGRNGSTIDYDSNYAVKTKYNSSAIDTITKQPVGSVYGPYVDGGNYVIAKVVAIKDFPDSAKARHILIPTVNPQNFQPIVEDSVAKKQADSILKAIKGGADFAALAKQYSSDPGSKDKGGVYDYFGFGKMMPEFNDFAFTKPAGTIDVVKTAYGYHIIEAMGQKGNSPKYKIAFMAKEILASDVTIQNASLNATKLSAQKNTKELESYIAKNGLQKQSLPFIVKENDSRIGQFQDARLLVRWIFEAKQGDISEPFNIDNNQFVVAVVDKIQEEGTQDAKTARPAVEGVIRNQKKADIIIAKLGNVTSLEKATEAYGNQVQNVGADSSLTYNRFNIPNIGEEPKLIGASFNKENQTKISAPIAGGTGVFVLKVNSVGSKPADAVQVIASEISQKQNILRTGYTNGWFEGLKNQVTIKDYRSKYF